MLDSTADSAPDQDYDSPLFRWWRATVEADVLRTVPKIEDYGTRDLEAMGQFLAVGRNIQLDPQQAAIYGCMYYAVGKIARAIAALERGQDPGEDTLFDLSIYSMMARAYNEQGGIQ